MERPLIRHLIRNVWVFLLRRDVDQDMLTVLKCHLLWNITAAATSLDHNLLLG